MTDKYYHILFKEKGYDFTLKEAQIILDPKLNEYEFILQDISHLDFDIGTLFTLVNYNLNIEYEVIVVKRYADSLVLRIIE